jgi:zinc transport system substrate-binding protein
MSKPFASLLIASACSLPLVGHAAALEGVVASIKPVHSLVAGVMEGIASPALLVDGAGSPHAYSMRPSQARALENAGVVFWVGPGLETFLAGSLETLGADATVVELADAEGLVLHGFREGGPFEEHDHGAEGHDDGDHADEGAHDEGHAHDGDHAHGGHDDMHLWLDPLNARILVGKIGDVLAEADPGNADAYAANVAAMSEKLDALVSETEAELAPVKDKGFIVFHDAYQYYEKRFGIEAAGSITVSPEAQPGAQRVSEIKAKVAELDAACVFAEPQFEPRLISIVAEGTDARTAVLDPLGADIEDGPDLYFELIRNLTTSLTTCLGGRG